MNLKYNSELPNHSEIKGRMDTMTLAFDTVESNNTIAVLEDGKKIYKGDAEITKHLDEIAGELHNWYYSNC